MGGFQHQARRLNPPLITTNNIPHTSIKRRENLCENQQKVAKHPQSTGSPRATRLPTAPTNGTHNTLHKIIPSPTMRKSSVHTVDTIQSHKHTTTPQHVQHAAGQLPDHNLSPSQSFLPGSPSLSSVNACRTQRHHVTRTTSVAKIVDSDQLNKCDN